MHIAVITPAFNVAPFLRDTIRSVLGQSHRNWSLTVIDDGSTDLTASVAASFHDPRITLIRQSNAGVSAARNRGIMTCFDRDGTDRQAEACLFLDGDDWLAAPALGVLAQTLDEAPWAAAACGRYTRVGPDGAARTSPSPPQGCLLEPLLTRNLFANGGHLLIRREAIEAAGHFRCDLTYGEDWEYWTRIAQAGEFAAVPSRRPVLFVRERQEGAYLSRATDPAAYRPALDAIYRNPDLANRLGYNRIDHLRSKAEAEAAWTIGRELIRHGRHRDGQRWLARSVSEQPSLKRLGLISLSWLHTGPFRRYQSVT